VIPCNILGLFVYKGGTLKLGMEFACIQAQQSPLFCRTWGARYTSSRH